MCVCHTNSERVCLGPRGTYPAADSSGSCNEIWMCECVCVREVKKIYPSALESEIQFGGIAQGMG